MGTEHLCMGCMGNQGAATVCPHCGWVQGTGPETPYHLPPGAILGHKYIIGQALEQDLLGVTYLAWDLNLSLKLTVKEYLPRTLAYREVNCAEVRLRPGESEGLFAYGLERFLEEAKILARFEGNSSIATIRDSFKANDTGYQVFNFLEGLNLAGYLERVGKISFGKAQELFMPVMDALKEVHSAGMLHLDISPYSIFVTGTGRTMLIEFGLIRYAFGERSPDPKTALRHGFAPGELYRSPRIPGPWTDIYALAATFYQAITGSPPPPSPDRLANDTLIAPSKLGVKIKEHEERTLLKAMAVSSADRYKTVQDLQRALRPY